MPQRETIKFIATVWKVTTLADGGLRVTLDLGEGAILEAAKLMEVKRAGLYGDIEFKPVGSEEP